MRVRIEACTLRSAMFKRTALGADLRVVGSRVKATRFKPKALSICNMGCAVLGIKPGRVYVGTLREVRKPKRKKAARR